MKLNNRLFFILLVASFLFIICTGLTEEALPPSNDNLSQDQPLSLILVAMKNSDYYPFHPATVKILKNADITFANLESPFGTGGKPVPCKGIWFRANPAFAPKLKDAGIDIVSLANNHILDYDVEVFLETLRILKENQISYVGAGNNAAEAGLPVIITAKNKKVAFLAYSQFAGIHWDNKKPRTFLATDNQPGVLPIKVGEIEAKILQIRSEVDYIVVSLHWGVEYSHYPTKEQQKIARRLIDAGADVIAGHHPHVLQGIEYYNGGLIFYSLGNFIFDQLPLARRESMIAKIVFQERPLIQIFPVLINYGQPEPAGGKEGREILNKIRRYSEKWSGLNWPDMKTDDK